MRTVMAALAALALLATACGQSASHDDALVDIGAGLQGPAGARASVYAAGLTNAAALAFDRQRRLWVATADYADTGDDAVSLIAGAGQRPITAIAGLHAPLGLLWYQDELYVSSKVGVDAYGGFDGTHFATQRTIVAVATDAGEPNGVVLGPDGRMRLGISAPCDHCTPTNPWSASIISFLPDGSDIRVETTKLRAPIALAYDPGTSNLFVTVNHRDDLGDKTPGDWLVIAKPGQNWRFPDCYGQRGSACDGVPDPVAVLDKHAAVSGLAIVMGQLGKRVGHAALVAEWKSGKVLQLGLNGATSTRPFLTGLQQPMPLALDAGALFAGDWATGTIYRVAPVKE